MQTFIADLAQKMVAADGLGLAAPQVGKNIRLVVINTEDGPQAFINPFVFWKSLKKEIGEEGCLSIPNVWGLVKRSKSLILTYYDNHAKKHRLQAQGLLARVLQHEIDHLNGVLFIDRMIQSKTK